MYESNYSSGYGTVFYLIFLGVYFYYTYAQYKIALKAGHHSSWWAFIPILNLFQLVQLAGKQWWWFLLFFVPVVNIICLAIVWMETAKNCGHPPIWGFLTIFPFLNLITIGIMAFTRGQFQKTIPQPKYEKPAPRQPERVS